MDWHLEYHTPTRGLSFAISELLYTETSQYQRIDIVQTPDFGKVMLLDKVVMVTEADEWVYHEMLAQPALFTHPNPERVLIIGGGDGGTLRQVLRHPEVKEAVLVEIDEMVVRVAKDYFPVFKPAFDDSRATILYEDGIAYLKRQKAAFDIILIDGTDPVGFAAGLFHKDFYTDCFNALKADGIFTIQSESPWIPDLQKVIRHAYDDLKSLFPIVMPYTAAIQTYQAGLWMFQMASKKYHPLTDVNEAEYKDYVFNYYGREQHQACFVLPAFVNRLLDINGRFIALQESSTPS